MTSPLLTWGDHARLAQLAISLAAMHWDGVRDAPDTGRSAEQELRALGFSDQLIEAFFRPFLAGIRLRRDLSTSAAVALFDLKMLVRGRAALPARRMRALPEALAADLPSGAIRLATPVLKLLRDDHRQFLGVRTPDGELRGSAVVLAADGDSPARLTGLDLPRIGLGSATLYPAGRQRLYSQKLLVLNALPDASVNDAMLLTDVVPEYAPPAGTCSQRTCWTPTVWTTAPSKHVLEPICGAGSRTWTWRAGEYDTLVLAPGSRTDYQGVPGAAEYSLPLRTLEDALRLRERVGTHLRQTARTGDSGFTFLVVGGGYTGIELAAELAYRSADPGWG